MKKYYQAIKLLLITYFLSVSGIFLVTYSSSYEYTSYRAPLNIEAWHAFGNVFLTLIPAFVLVEVYLYRKKYSLGLFRDVLVMYFMISTAFFLINDMTFNKTVVSCIDLCGIQWFFGPIFLLLPGSIIIAFLRVILHKRFPEPMRFNTFFQRIIFGHLTIPMILSIILFAIALYVSNPAEIFYKIPSY